MLLQDGQGGYGILPEWRALCIGGPAPEWLHSYCFGGSCGCCQCSLLGRPGYHHPGMLCSSFLMFHVRGGAFIPVCGLEMKQHRANPIEPKNVQTTAGNRRRGETDVASNE